MTTETRIHYARPAGTYERPVFYPMMGSDPALQGGYQTWVNYGPLEQVFLQQPFRDLHEIYTPNDVGPRTEWKDFEHYKLRASMSNSRRIPQVTTWYTRYDGAEPGYPYHLGFRDDPICGFSAFGGADNPVEGLTPLYVSGAADGHFVPAPASLNTLLGAGLTACLPRVKAELSLLNSLYELKDFRSLPRTVNSLKSLYKRLTTDSRVKTLLYGKFKYRVKREMFSNAKDASDCFLQWKFNLAPLWSDVCGYHRALTALERRLNHLITQSAKLQRRHYTVALPELESPTDQKSVGFGYPQNSRIFYSTNRRVVRAEASKFHMEIEYNYSFTQYQREHARILLLLDSFGVNFNPAIIWNAIPWTFVIDWVVGVSQYLKQFTLLNMEPKINIRRALWSIERSRTISCMFSMNMWMSQTYPHQVNEVPASTVTETAYRRQSFMPTLTQIRLSGLNSDEFTLGAALALAKKRTYRKR